MTDQKDFEMARGGSEPDMCDNHELMVRFLLHQTSKKENEQVYRHLNQCAACYEMVQDTATFEYRRPSPEEAAEVQGLLQTPPEVQVEKMVELYQKLNPPKPGGPFARFLNRLHTVWKNFFLLSVPSVRWGFVVLILLASLFGMERLWFFYQTTYQIRMAEDTLQKEYHIFFKDTPQLAGNYESTGKGILMSSPEEITPLQAAKSRLESVLQKDPNSPEARRLLAQVYMIEGDYERAGQVFAEAGNVAAQSAPFWNDRGVLAFRQQKWDEAIRNFQKALELDPDFPEAYYNLALTLEKTGNLGAALDNLDRYIELETNEGWKNAALSTRMEWTQRDAHP